MSVALSLEYYALRTGQESKEQADTVNPNIAHKV